MSFRNAQSNRPYDFTVAFSLFNITLGAICDKDGDCGDGCCVIEPTIDERHGTCKNKLEEFHQCSPVLFRKVWIGDEKPECGPCADGLECVERG